jgi:hypothetical protein
MQPLSGYVATLAVAVVFYVWRGYVQVQLRRQRQLRERVTYLLWILSERIDPRDSGIIHRLSSG